MLTHEYYYNLVLKLYKSSNLRWLSNVCDDIFLLQSNKSLTNRHKDILHQVQVPIQQVGRKFLSFLVIISIAAQTESQKSALYLFIEACIYMITMT